MNITRERYLHVAACAAVFIGWYTLSLLVALLPGYAGLYRNGLALPALMLLFWLPFTLIVWYHYQKRYGAMPLGRVTLPGLLIPAAALFALMLIQQYMGSAEPWSEQLVESNRRDLIIMAFAACLGAPITEEIVFRGFPLNTGLGYGKRGEMVAIIVTSLLFAVVHTQYQNPTTFVWLFIFSAILCHTRLRTGSLLIPMLLHAMTNALLLLPLL